MSYLHSPRITFSGDFQADVSTINNEVRHYDNANFQPSFQDYGSGSVNGWWNPNGGAAFRFVNCTVQSVERLDGTVITDSTNDPVIGQLVSGPDDKSSGKMVDLDPQQQMTTELITVGVRLYTENNDLLLQGAMAASGFRDLGTRQLQGGNVNGQALGALWTSVLSDLQWGEAVDSPLLRELKESVTDGKLAINLTGFGYYYNHANDGRFSMGRILGCIGPWHPGEPERFAPARRLYSAIALANQTNPQQPMSIFSASNFIVSEDKQQLTLDLGNSIPLQNALGEIHAAFLQLKLAVVKSEIPDLTLLETLSPISLDPSQYELIGQLDFTTSTEWLLNTSGIVSMKIPTAAQNIIADHQLVLLWERSPGNETVVAQESENGIMAKADQNVQRINPGESRHVDFYAYKWGRPVSKNFSLTLSQAGPEQPANPQDPVFPNTPTPATGMPQDAVEFTSAITTDADGKWTIEINGRDPKNPRGYIDGQIYGIQFALADTGQTLKAYSLDQIFILLFDDYVIPDKPSWKDVAPIWTQFGNLYPVMSKHIVDMNSRSAILKRKDLLMYAFSLKQDDPMYMPVTRDLSENKRAVLLKWLQNPTVDNVFSDQEMEQMKNAPHMKASTLESAAVIETEETKALKQLMLSKGGVMDAMPMPDFSPADLTFEKGN